ncbi:uncharacterized protein [Amphiura filiformis]|uniref:uncharacterized protein n=1 Tax=Amphiura filiformis TaxID=82378 RepID=UPI003B20D688
MEGWLILPPTTVGIAIGLSISALCSDHWTQTPAANSGLWSACYYKDESQEWICGDAEWEHPNWILAVKVLVIISVGLGLLTAISELMAVVNKSAGWSRLAFFVVIFQEIFLAVGLFVFFGYVMNYRDRSDLSWSYALGWISVGFYVLGLIFFSQQAKRLRSDDEYERIGGYGYTMSRD